jgi:hypothetical protein
MWLAVFVVQQWDKNARKGVRRHRHSPMHWVSKVRATVSIQLLFESSFALGSLDHIGLEIRCLAKTIDLGPMMGFAILVITVIAITPTIRHDINVDSVVTVLLPTE